MWTFLQTMLFEVFGKYLDLHISPCPQCNSFNLGKKPQRNQGQTRSCHSPSLPVPAPLSRCGAGRGRQPGDAPSVGTLPAGAVTYILNMPNRKGIPYTRNSLCTSFNTTFFIKLNLYIVNCYYNNKMVRLIMECTIKIVHYSLTVGSRKHSVVTMVLSSYSLPLWNSPVEGSTVPELELLRF